MGCEHLLKLAALSGTQVVAVADLHADSEQAAVALANLVDPTGFSRLQVFCSQTALSDSRFCDVLAVATPTMTHAQILPDILAHPKPHHILVEKPLCTTIADCRKVIALQMQGRKFWCKLDWSTDTCLRLPCLSNTSNGSSGKRTDGFRHRASLPSSV